MIRVYIIILVISVASIITTPFIVTAKTASILGSRYDVPSEEVELDQDFADFLATAASSAGYNARNMYGSDTTKSNILQAASAFGDPGANDFAFYIGHSGCTSTIHFYIITDAGTNVYDDEIYPYSADRYVIFVNLWACYQGGMIGFISGDEVRGMPLAWLHTTDLSGDGYANPDGKGYAFLGFTGEAPGLSNIDEQFTSGSSCLYPLYSFATEFYATLLGCYAEKRDIRKALDFASWQVWGKERFSETVLYQGFSTSEG